jgi:hypothetical protein
MRRHHRSPESRGSCVNRLSMSTSFDTGISRAMEPWPLVTRSYGKPEFDGIADPNRTTIDQRDIGENLSITWRQHVRRAGFVNSD